MLNVILKGTNIELTDAIVAAIQKKIGMLDKYLAHMGTPKEIRVEVGKTTHHHKKGRVFRVEVNLRLPAHLLRAEATSYKLYDAIDLAKDEVKREISKVVGTHRDALRKGVRRLKELGNESDLAH